MNTRLFPLPWRHESEISLVRDYFYPQHVNPDPYLPPPPDMRQRAVDMVNGYVFKNPTTPHAMVATSHLTEAVIHDTQASREQYISYNAMTSIYAFAFAKFVTGFVDRDVAKTNCAALTLDPGSMEVDEGEDDAEGSATSSDQESVKPKIKVKGGGERSMYAYAARIGMPEHFVDIRHQIVHGELPSLEELRRCVQRALDWLWNRWWLKNASASPERAMREVEENNRIAVLARNERIRVWLDHHSTQTSSIAAGHRTYPAEDPQTRSNDARMAEILEDAGYSKAGLDLGRIGVDSLSNA